MSWIASFWERSEEPLTVVTPELIVSRSFFPEERTSAASPLEYPLTAVSKVPISAAILSRTGVMTVNWAMAPVVKARVANLILSVVGRRRN